MSKLEQVWLLLTWSREVCNFLTTSNCRSKRGVYLKLSYIAHACFPRKATLQFASSWGKTFLPTFLYTSGGLITRVDVCTQDLRIRKSGSKSGCFWHGVGKSETLLTTSDFRSNHSQCENLNLLQFPHFPIFSSIQVPELKLLLNQLHITSNQTLPAKTYPYMFPPAE